MHRKPPLRGTVARPAPRRAHSRAAPIALLPMLGLAAALLTACSSVNPGMIPAANAGPLQADFETVAQDAQTGNGSCGETATAIRKTEQDFSELPSTLAANLRSALSSGIANLSSRALVLCAKPLTQSTTTSTTVTRTATATFTTTETTTTTEVTSSSTPTTTSPGGGTVAPGGSTGVTEPAPGAGSGGAAVGAQEGIK